MNNLKPYAMSQIAEQVIRVIWMLLATFIIMKLGSGDYLAAVTQSTFAAFVGMVASFAVLIYFLAQEGSLKESLKQEIRLTVSVSWLIPLRKPFLLS